MNVLVTGGAGFIGSNLIAYLIEKTDYRVVCVDNFNDYYDPQIKERNIAPFIGNPRFKLVRADICDESKMAELFENEAFEKVCHLAARAGVRASIKDPLLYEKVNVGGTLNLLELSRQHAVKQFVFASSSSVYGEQPTAPFKEDMNVDQPLSPYAATKRAAELLAYTYYSLYGLRCVGLRFFTVYGPAGRPDMAPYKFTDLISNDQPIEQYGDGHSKRDYTFIDDICPAIHSALEADLEFEIINLGNDQPVELRQLINSIESALGKQATIEQVPMPASDVPMTHADITKAKKLLNYSPATHVEDGIAKFVEWYNQIQL